MLCLLQNNTGTPDIAKLIPIELPLTDGVPFITVQIDLRKLPGGPSGAAPSLSNLLIESCAKEGESQTWNTLSSYFYEISYTIYI